MYKLKISNKLKNTFKTNVNKLLNNANSMKLPNKSILASRVKIFMKKWRLSISF